MGLTIAKVYVFIMSFLRMAYGLVLLVVGGYVLGDKNLKPCIPNIDIGLYLMLGVGALAFIVGLTGALSILLSSLCCMASHVGLLFAEILFELGVGLHGILDIKIPFAKEMTVFYLIPVVAGLNIIELCCSVYLCCQWPPYQEYLG